MAEQSVTMTCTEKQGKDAQHRSCPQLTGPMPAKAGASGGKGNPDCPASFPKISPDYVQA